MNLFRLFCTIYLLITASSYGQSDKKVIVYQGRKAPFMKQVVLDLSYQGLRTLPLSASNQEIEILILDNNKLETLPNWIGNLKNLRVLSIRSNNLIEVNPLLSYCSNLEQLYLNGNYNLTEIPNLSSCKSLRIIELIETKIDDVPLWVEMLDSLYYFKYTRIK